MSRWLSAKYGVVLHPDTYEVVYVEEPPVLALL